MMNLFKRKVRLGVICCFGINGANCAGCPYYKSEALEEMTCDMELARDLLEVIEERDRAGKGEAHE